MARCIDLFIDIFETDSGNGGGVPFGEGAPGEALPAGLAELAAELTAITGLRLVEQPGGAGWAADVDGARVELVEHDLFDDRHLALSSYRYDLFARVPTADANVSPEAVLLRRVLGLVKADGRFRALLVWDLQNVIGRAGGGPVTAGSAAPFAQPAQ